MKSRERLLAVFTHNFLLAGAVSLLAGSIHVEAIHDDPVGAKCVCVRKQRCVHTHTILSADADVTLRLLRASGRNGAGVVVSDVFQLHSCPRKEGFTKSYVLYFPYFAGVPEQSGVSRSCDCLVPGPTLYSPSC